MTKVAWVSGFCNASNPVASHDRCKGVHGDVPCGCACHVDVEPIALDPVTITRFQPDLAALAHELRTHADALNEAVVDVDGPWQDATRVLHELVMARQTISVVEGALTAYIAAQWREEKIRDAQEVDGLGRVDVRRGSDRKSWDHEGLINAVVKAELEKAGGQLPDDPFTVARWVTDAGALSYWRATKLKALGIDVSEYCATSPGRTSVQITSNDEIGATA